MDIYNKCFTAQRLQRYAVSVSNEREIVDKYLWNIQLSKELYGIIAIFEVSFRNHINASINKNISGQWLLSKAFLEQLLDANLLAFYQNAYNKLKSNNKLTEGRLIAELNLGFWINLFNRKYRVKLWNKPNIFEDIFPYFDYKCADRIGFIYPKLKEIQYIRNRISHHEAIFDYKPGLNNFYYDLLECLSWIDPEIVHHATRVSCFQAVWNKATPVT